MLRYICRFSKDMLLNVQDMRPKNLLVIMMRVARNAVTDLKYGGLLIGKIKTRHAHLGAHTIANSDYEALSLIFKDRIKTSDILVDVGCGKGRVINWWLSQDLPNHLIGIELDREVAEKTRQRLSKYKNVTIITGDAVQSIPEDGSLFYLYNPFAAHVMEDFKNRLLSLFGESGDITILYNRCKYVEVFQNDPAWSVDIVDIGGPSILPFDQLAVIKIRR